MNAVASMNGTNGSSGMNALSGMANWPVGHAAAAVLGASGVLCTYGDFNIAYRLASVTKPLTALAVLVAVEEGALELSEELPAELGELLPGATVSHLLAHASGIGPDRRRRLADPGSRRIYSNAGFEVLGEVVERATGIDFASYLADSVFRPLGMTTAVLDGSPASGGRASVADLSAVVTQFLTPQGFLDPSTLAAMASVRFPGLRGVLPGYGTQDDNDWGLGVEIRARKSPHWTSARNSPATYGHFGRAGTMFWIDPVAQIGLIALADRDFDDWAVQAWPALSDAVLDAYG
jgi:CubicO group peptidase (beta-lactamase class C family)